MCISCFFSYSVRTLITSVTLSFISNTKLADIWALTENTVFYSFFKKKRVKVSYYKTLTLFRLTILSTMSKNFLIFNHLRLYFSFLE